MPGSEIHRRDDSADPATLAPFLAHGADVVVVDDEGRTTDGAPPTR
jgi:hypothetical protein